MLAKRKILNFIDTKRGKQVAEGFFNIILFRFRNRAKLGCCGDFREQPVIQEPRIHPRRKGREEKPKRAPVTPLQKYFQPGCEKGFFPIFKLSALVIEEIKEVYEIDVPLRMLAILFNSQEKRLIGNIGHGRTLATLSLLFGLVSGWKRNNKKFWLSGFKTKEKF